MFHDGYYFDKLEDGVLISEICKPAYYDNNTGQSYPEICVFFDQSYNLHACVFSDENGKVLAHHHYDS